MASPVQFSSPTVAQQQNCDERVGEKPATKSKRGILCGPPPSGFYPQGPEFYELSGASSGISVPVRSKRDQYIQHYMDRPRNSFFASILAALDFKTGREKARVGRLSRIATAAEPLEEID